MFQQIGLHHVFDSGEISYCLVCTEIITENSNLDKDDCVFQHLQGKKHEKCVIDLFKLCISDPKCDSRDVKYLDIITNSEFDVTWEIGKEQSYICRKDGFFDCLICQENLCETVVKIEQVLYLVRDHLHSKQHVEKISTNIWWTYHPTLDINYVAFCKQYMFCSLCQKSFVSREHSLLQFVADHIQLDLNFSKSYSSSKASLNSGLNGCTYEVYIDSCDENIKSIENPLNKVKLSGNSCENSESNESGSMKTDCKIRLNYADYFSKREESSNEGNPVSDENISSSLSLINISEKDDVLKCPECNEQVELYNDDVTFSMLKHAQKHKDLSDTSYDCISNNICNICHKQFEMFNKNLEISYHFHLQNFHSGNLQCSDSGENLETDNCVTPAAQESNLSSGDVKIVNTFHDDRNHHDNSKEVVNSDSVTIMQEPQESSSDIVKIFNSLPKSMEKHQSYIKVVNGQFYCNLCTCSLMSTNHNTKTACDILKAHFFTLFHDRQLRANTFDSCPDVEDYMDISQLFQFEGLKKCDKNVNKHQTEFSKSTNKSDVNQHESSKEVVNSSHSTIILEPEESSNDIDTILNSLLESMDKHENFITVVNRQFYCNLCNCSLLSIYENTKTACEVLKAHFLTLFHVNQLEACLTNNVDSAVQVFEKGNQNQLNIVKEHEVLSSHKGKVRSIDEMQDILNELSKKHEIVREYLNFISIRDGLFHCDLCRSSLKCTLTGKKLIKHLNGTTHLEKFISAQHQKPTKPKQNKKGKAKKRLEVLRFLNELKNVHDEVKQNFKNLDEKLGHFYCKICNEIVMCNLSGNKLIEHLSGFQHFENVKLELGMKKRTNEQVSHILKELAYKFKVVNDNFNAIGVKKKHFYCYTCNVVLMFSKNGKTLTNHLGGKKHMSKFLPLPK